MNEATEKKKVIFSAVKPTGALTLGSYAGALKNWIAMQNAYECFYCVADMHSIFGKTLSRCLPCISLWA